MQMTRLIQAILAYGIAAAQHTREVDIAKRVTLYNWSLAPGERGVIAVSQFLLSPDHVLCSAKNYTLPSPRFTCNDTRWAWSLAQADNEWDMHLWYKTGEE
jgi:hypothetical protein